METSWENPLTEQDECEHSIVFNYRHSISRCAVCGADIITMKNGDKLTVESIQNMWEVYKHEVLQDKRWH
jgi:Zn finger protein HypA/HybF involved in hydrogenase expression